MKKLLLATLIAGAFLFSSETKAQVRLNVNLSVGARPGWGLPGNHAGNYYYLPEIDSYYDIPNRQFIYLDRGNWTFGAQLPVMYRDYDLYNGYKVVINEPRPYLNCNIYRSRYSRYYNTYRRPVFIAQGPVYRIGDDRNYRGRDDGRYDRRFDNDRNNRYDRDDRNDRGRGDDRDNDRGRSRRGRG